MELTNYKEIKIEVSSTGEFKADGISGWYDTYAKAQKEIDRVLKAETKKNFPVEVISSSMKMGKITSLNTYTDECWFSRVNGVRSKERTHDYSGRPRFFAINKNNTDIIIRYNEIERAIKQLSDEKRGLENRLTEPMTFSTTDKDS